MKNYFKCFRLFLETGKKITDTNLKAKYYESLLEYGLDGTLPNDPIVDALLTSAMYSIDKSEQISEIKSEAGKKHSGNQYTMGDTKWKAQKNQVEQNGTDWNTMEQNGTGRNKKNRSIEDIEVIEDNRSNKKSINKKLFKDFVYLAQDEYDKLVMQLGNKQTEELIDKLNNYIGSTGKRYKSHYFTILNRAKKEGGTTTHSQAELMKERDRQRRLEEAQEILNRSKNQDATSTTNQTFDRRANIVSG